MKPIFSVNENKWDIFFTKKKKNLILITVIKTNKQYVFELLKYLYIRYIVVFVFILIYD